MGTRDWAPQIGRTNLGAVFFGRGPFGRRRLGEADWATAFGRDKLGERSWAPSILRGGILGAVDWARPDWATAIGHLRLGAPNRATGFLGAGISGAGYSVHPIGRRHFGAHLLATILWTRVAWAPMFLGASC